jgi:L-amino acid N-acyltransferase YncA
MEPVIIQTLQAQHWAAVRAIYQAGIGTGHATFESQAPESFEQWLEGHVPELCLIAIGGGTPLGWAALGRASNRSVYAGVAEESVYVAPSHSRRGIGRRLLAQLILQSEERGYWTLQAGVFPENQWRDVLLLERRSQRVGID